MAGSAIHSSIFLFGAFFLASVIALIGAESSREGLKITGLQPNTEDSGADNDNHSLQTRGLWDNFDLSSLFNSVINNANNHANRQVAEEEDRWEEEEDVDESGEHDTTSTNGSHNSFNNFGTGKQNFRGAVINTGGTTDSFNHEGDGDQDFSGAVINSGGKRVVVGDIAGFKNSPINVGSDEEVVGDIAGFSNSPISIGGFNIVSDGIIGIGNGGGSFIKMDSNGLILHVLSSGNKGVSMINNKIYIGNKLICSDLSKKTAKPTHQKTPDGSRWYTNIKVGEPMSQAEVDQFDKDWAESERQHKERMDALNARLKREAEERDRYQKELQARLKREAEERDQYQKDLQARLKREAEERAKQQRELQARLQREAEERARQQRERMDALNRRLQRQADERARRSSRSNSWW